MATTSPDQNAPESPDNLSRGNPQPAPDGFPAPTPSCETGTSAADDSMSTHQTSPAVRANSAAVAQPNPNQADTPAPIGIFDSGIGGFSVLREIRAQLPGHPVLYYADRGNHPYGTRPLPEVRDICTRITAFLLSHGARVVVIACNTASAAALYHLRESFPGTDFVGMEPALKPAVEASRSRHVGVLATAGTLRGQPYAGVVERFARDVTIHEQACSGLAELIEHDAPTGDILPLLEAWLRPMRTTGVDQLALACTHYPLIIDLIREVAGPDIRVIDPSAAIARQTRRVLALRGLLCDNLPDAAGLRCFVSAPAPDIAGALRRHCATTGTVEETPVL